MGIFSGAKREKQTDQFQESARLLREAIGAYKKAVNDGASQYNETRKKAEEEINRGTRITKHRINL